MPLPADLRQRIAAFDHCNARERCVLLYGPGAREAVIVGAGGYPTEQIKADATGSWQAGFTVGG